MQAQPGSVHPGAPLELRLFSPWTLLRDGTTLSRTRTRKEQGPRSPLTLRREQALGRDWLPGLFWPDTPKTSSLSKFRRSLDHSGMSVDVVEFGEAITCAGAAFLTRGVDLSRAAVGGLL